LNQSRHRIGNCVKRRSGTRKTARAKDAWHTSAKGAP